MTSFFDGLRQDLRFAIRHFARAPLVTATIVLMLSLGIGANSALFTMALGARQSQLVAHFSKVGLKLSAIGIAIGFPVSVVVLRLSMSSIDYRGPNTWVVVGAISLVVITVAAFATWLPARRAASVDPLVALRSE